jgi:hypothetical protein
MHKTPSLDSHRRARRRVPTTVSVVALLSLGAVLLAPISDAKTDSRLAAPPQATEGKRVRATIGPDTILKGSGAKVAARGSTRTAVRRPVILQRFSGKWVGVRSKSTGPMGKYVLRDPRSRAGNFRVVAPAFTQGRRHFARRVSTPTLVTWQSTLSPDRWLEPGQSLISPNGRFRLTMQRDGNLVQLDGPTDIWASGTNGAGAHAVMQTDGNFVIYQGGTALWGARTDTFNGAYIVLQDDGNLVIYQAGLAIWDRGRGRLFNQLQPGQTLGVNQSIMSTDHRFRLIMQSDGNLVEYGPTGALWSTHTSVPGSWAAMQTDGQLVVWSPQNQAIWVSGVLSAGAHLQVLNDDNIVIYQGATVVWTKADGGSGGGGGSGSAKGQAAADWSRARIANTSYDYACLRFVREAWAAQGIDLRAQVSVGWGSDTYPADVWGHFKSGTTGGTSTPPVGALVFYSGTTDRTTSHVTIYVGNNQVVSTKDYLGGPVHYETYGQHVRQVGWWLPAG